MKVIIYTRVSTDEQKENGFSLQDQERRLKQYCEEQKKIIVKHYQEDYSAKDFNRPTFQNLLNDLKEKKVHAQQLICVKYDRFSRNLEETLRMTRVLKNFGVEVKYLESNYDSNNPQDLLLHVINAALPQIDNEIRAANTTRGMRQALREGRWVWKAPKGYKNDTFKKLIQISEESGFIIEAFKEVSKGISSIDQVRAKLKKQGFKCSKQHFLNILKNPFYIGKIRIKQWKNEPEQIVKGIHEPIIDEELFERVQNVLAPRCRKQPKKSKYTILFPLRGHLICQHCGNALTASSSKGRKMKYDYYHCQGDCKVRMKAGEVNESYLNHIHKLTLSNDIASLYNEIMKDVFSEREGNKIDNLTKLDSQIHNLNEKLKKVDDKYISGNIEDSDYKRLSKNVKDDIERLESEKVTFCNTETNLDRYFAFGLSMMTNLPFYYEHAPIEIKHSITGSIFPEKLIFDGKNYRTARVNSLISLIADGARELKGVKKKKATISSGLSSLALPLGLEPRTL